MCELGGSSKSKVACNVMSRNFAMVPPPNSRNVAYLDKSGGETSLHSTIVTHFQIAATIFCCIYPSLNFQSLDSFVSWTLSYEYSSGLLHFQGCGVVGYLLNVDWLALEITFGKELPISAKVESLILRIFDHIPTLHFFVIAMSRCFAVFLPLTYNKLAQSRKFFSLLSIACLILSIVTSLAETFCVGQVSDDAFPTHNIRILGIGPKREDAEGVKVQMAMDFIPLIITVCGIFFYIAAVIRMLIWRLLETRKKTWTTKLEKPKFLMGDQMRLFLMCLFIYLSYITLLLLAVIVTSKLDSLWSKYVTLVGVTLTTVSEPVVLFAMSKQIRKEFPGYCWMFCRK
ncbi:hypothetical protein Ddc_12146 [Ditylenchus destructor]|nr:hypothetical protein Ddc_12146 [Ditylenchus destructor]